MKGGVKLMISLKHSTAIVLAAILLLFCACSDSTVQNSENRVSSEQLSESEKSSDSNEILANESLQQNSSQSKFDVPKEWQDNGIFSEYYDKAYDIVKNMTLDEKIGQMIFARCPSENAAETAAKYHIGGYVLFGRDFKDKSREQIISDILSYKNSQEIPMAVAVDEEGGTVVRISDETQIFDHKFDSPRNIYNDGGMDKIKSEEKQKAELLSSLGIDVNLAPVCDISVNESDFMYNRSLGQDAQTTAEFVDAVIDINQSVGVSVTLKHFPGYGNNTDTHIGIAIDNRDYSEFENNDFIPFRAGINSNAHFVMVSHNIVKCMDREKPASISADVHKILRDELNFSGIIITDDLDMNAIRIFSKEYSPAISAVLAGNDMIILSDVSSAVNDIKQAVNDNVIDESLIDCAVMRVLSWKWKHSAGE